MMGLAEICTFILVLSNNICHEVLNLHGEKSPIYLTIQHQKVDVSSLNIAIIDCLRTQHSVSELFSLDVEHDVMTV